MWAEYGFWKPIDIRPGGGVPGPPPSDTVFGSDPRGVGNLCQSTFDVVQDIGMGRFVSVQLQFVNTEDPTLWELQLTEVLVGSGANSIAAMPSTFRCL